MNGTWHGASRIGKGNRVRLSHGDQVGLLGPVTSHGAHPPFIFELCCAPTQPPPGTSPRLSVPLRQPWVTETRAPHLGGLSTQASLLQPGPSPLPLQRAPQASHQQLVGHNNGRSSTPAAHVAIHPYRSELFAGRARCQATMAGRESAASAVDHRRMPLSHATDLDRVVDHRSVPLSHATDLDRSRASGPSCPSPPGPQLVSGRAAVMSHAPHHMARPVKESKVRPYQPQRDPRRRLADGSVRHIVLPAGADPLDQVQPSSRCVTATAPPSDAPSAVAANASIARPNSSASTHPQVRQAGVELGAVQRPQRADTCGERDGALRGTTHHRHVR